MAWTTTPPMKAGKYWFKDADGDQLLVVLGKTDGALYVNEVFTAKQLWRRTFIIYLGNKPQDLGGQWWSEPLQEPPWDA